MPQCLCLACLTSDPCLPPHPTPPQRSVSESSLVAMDFSGRTGRVIDNPVEAQSAALEEGQTWRVRWKRKKSVLCTFLLVLRLKSLVLFLSSAETEPADECPGQPQPDAPILPEHRYHKLIHSLSLRVLIFTFHHDKTGFCVFQ